MALKWFSLVVQCVLGVYSAILSTIAFFQSDLRRGGEDVTAYFATISVLGVLGVVVVVTAIINYFFPGGEPSGLVINKARWGCTVIPSASLDATKHLQGMVVGNTLKVHAHDSVLGDVCNLHRKKEERGHAKSLLLDFTYSGRATANHDDTLTIQIRQAISKKPR